MVKIVSWNVNSIRVRLPHLIELDKSVKPDIVMLQETKSTDENFPEEEISSLGYQIIKKGQKSYNGVAILSKTPIKQITEESLKNFINLKDQKNFENYKTFDYRIYDQLILK